MYSHPRRFKVLALAAFLSLAVFSLLAVSSAGETPDSASAPDTSPSLLQSLKLASYELTPAFSPAIHDYTIRCEKASRISVRYTALPAATVALNPQAPVLLSPGGLITVDVSTAELSDSYRVRCLPIDFPEFEVRGKPGVWIHTVIPAHGTRASYMVLLDEYGTPVYYRRHSSSPAVSYVSDEDLPETISAGLPEGTDAMLEIPLSYGEFGPFSLNLDTTVVLRSLEGTELRSWKAPKGLSIDHHDAVLLPSGNLLVISYQETAPPKGMESVPFAASHPVFGEPDCTSGPFNARSDYFMDSVILEITPEGSLLKRFSLKEMLGSSAISFPVRFDTDRKDDAAHCVFDAYHANALDLTASGDVLVSGLGMDGAVLIDPRTSRVIYRVGGPSDKSSFAVANDPLGGLSRIHDGRLSPSGLLSVFDNRIAHPTENSRGVLYRVDTTRRTATFVSSFETSCDAAPCASQWGGSFRVAENGSFVLAAGGRDNGPSIEVLSASGEVISSIRSANVYRAVPVSPGLSRSRLAALTSSLNTDPVVLDGTCNTDYFGVCS